MGRDLVLGMDFGTSYTVAGALIGGRIQYVLDNGDPTIPTVVYLGRTGEPLIGKNAQMKIATDPAATIGSVKRLLGHRYGDPEIRAIDAGVGYRIKNGPRGAPVIEAHGQTYATEQVAAIVLRRVRDLAEQRFGASVRRLVMGVPAASPSSYVAALRRAARIAQLDILQLVPEPIAGALALGLHQSPAERRVAVCDFGGGTFDASLIIQEGMKFNPVATSGDAFLGGDDFDEAFADAVAGSIYRQTRCDIRKDRARWGQLLMRVESAKRMLSTHNEAQLTMKDAYTVGGQRRDLDVLIERAWIEPRWEPLVDRSIAVFLRLLEKAGWAPDEVDAVLMIGGTSLVPLVQRKVGALFGVDKLITSDWANLAVAAGVSLQTAAHATVSTTHPVLVG